MKLVLASASKRRQDIFDMVGIKYTVVTCSDKEVSPAKSIDEYVKDLSRHKAEAVAKKLNEPAVIVSADTVVYMDGKVYEKPKSKDEAFKSMKEMSGKKTYVYTGMTVKDTYQNKSITDVDVCVVYVKEMTDDEIEWYVENQENILDISGYAMLGKADLFLDKVEGDYNTLFGISPAKAYEVLKSFGYKLADIT